MNPEPAEEFWNARYRSRSAVWSGAPNAALVAEVRALAPGSALDAGCGEGADAIWLAQRGWRVTAADISTVALERARAVPVALDVARRLDWVHCDLVAGACDAVSDAAPYDFVTAQFLQLPSAPRAVLFRRLAALVKPGGALLIVGHHPCDLQTSAPRPPLPELFYTAADVAALLEPDRWQILVEASRERSVDDPAGRAIGVTDAVLFARRRDEKR